MIKIAIVLFIGFFITACGGGNTNDSKGDSDPYESKKSEENGNPSYDSNRGVGKFTDVKLNPKLDAELALNGEKVYSVKCGSCHKLTSEKLVGPGWLGVTTRNKPEWILNFITNTDEMLNKDPKAQAQLEICLVRMPNQNIADNDAMALLEFMRKNDGVK